MDIRFGAVYLDRVDVKILPAGGVYWRPTPDWDVYLVFPNPKVRKFLTAIGNTKWYGYAAGEYGGGSWTVRRQFTDDRIDYNDIRAIGGVEWETQTLIRGHIEVGYVFDREVVFVSALLRTLRRTIPSCCVRASIFNSLPSTLQKMLRCDRCLPRS